MGIRTTIEIHLKYQQQTGPSDKRSLFSACNGERLADCAEVSSERGEFQVNLRQPVRCPRTRGDAEATIESALAALPEERVNKMLITTQPSAVDVAARETKGTLSPA